MSCNVKVTMPDFKPSNSPSLSWRLYQSLCNCWMDDPERECPIHSAREDSPPRQAGRLLS